MQKLNTLLLALVLLLVMLQFSSNRADDMGSDSPATAYLQTANNRATDANLVALAAEVATMRQELAALSAGLKAQSAPGVAPVKVAPIPSPETVASTNAFFDDLIASGRVAPADLMKVGMQLSRMDDSQRQAQMDKLATAINSRQVAFGEPAE